LFWDGNGVTKDRTKALEFVRKAAELGDANAWHKLGMYYDHGSAGLKRDPVESARWYRKAAEYGIPGAQNALGIFYLNGDGVEPDMAQAVQWFEKAAKSGHLPALNNLGDAYRLGSGVEKEIQKAIVLYRLAALRGHTTGQLKLANAYSNRWNDNPQPNYPLAYFWYLVMGNTTDAATVQKSSDGLTKMFHRVPSEQRAEIEADMRKWSPGMPEPVYSVADAIAAPAPRPDSSPRESTGSGFRVSKDKVLTNQHVVEKCKKLLVNGQPATLTASDDNADIALLSVKNLAGDVPQIRSEPARIGEDIAVAGYPLQGLLSGFNMTRGSVSSLSGLGGDTRLLQITAAVQPGNSGGPVVDGAGRVVGMVVSKLSWKTVSMTGSMPENVNFAINTNTLTSFLQAHQAGFSVGTGAARPLSPPDVADKVRTFAVLVNCSR
jgi:S1-C subfamily serine protease